MPPRSRKAFAIVLLQSLTLVVVGSLLALGVNSGRARRLPLVASAFDYQFRCEEPAVAAANRTLGVDEVARLRDRSDVAIVDIRAAEAYAQGHIPKAHSVPVSILAPTDPAKLAALSRYRTVVIYDEGDDLVHAEEFAGEVTAAKVADVRFLAPGLKGWVSAGRPITTGAAP